MASPVKPSIWPRERENPEKVQFVRHLGPEERSFGEYTFFAGMVVDVRPGVHLP